MCFIVYGMARIEPSRRSWSSVSSTMMFFCEPGAPCHGAGAGGGGRAAAMGMAPVVKAASGARLDEGGAA